MAAPRVTQQFIENIRGDTAVIPHGPRVTQQFIESILSINVGATAALAETIAATDAVFAGVVNSVTVAEAVAIADVIIGAQMIVNVPGAQGDCGLTVIVPGSSA